MKKWNHYFFSVKKMVRRVNRQYLIQLVEQYYIDQEKKNFFLSGDYNCKFCKESKNVEEKLRKKKYFEF